MKKSGGGKNRPLQFFVETFFLRQRTWMPDNIWNVQKRPTLSYFQWDQIRKSNTTKSRTIHFLAQKFFVRTLAYPFKLLLKLILKGKAIAEV